MNDTQTTTALAILPRQATLEELAATATQESEALDRAQRASLDHALKAGEALIEARARVPAGEWMKWVADNVPIPYPRVAFLIRLATLQEHFIGKTDTIGGAATYLAGLPAVNGYSHGGPLQGSGRCSGNRSAEVRAEATRMCRDGADPKEVAALFDLSPATVKNWASDDYERRRKKADSFRAGRARAAREALRRQENDQLARAARQAKDPLGESYALVRRALPVLEQATGDDAEERASIAVALRSLRAAEDAIVETLRMKRRNR